MTKPVQLLRRREHCRQALLPHLCSLSPLETPSARPHGMESGAHAKSAEQPKVSMRQSNVRGSRRSACSPRPM